MKKETKWMYAVVVWITLLMLPLTGLAIRDYVRGNCDAGMFLFCSAYIYWPVIIVGIILTIKEHRKDLEAPND
jgi:hypothetical protein